MHTNLKFRSELEAAAEDSAQLADDLAAMLARLEGNDERWSYHNKDKLLVTLFSTLFYLQTVFDLCFLSTFKNAIWKNMVFNQICVFRDIEAEVEVLENDFKVEAALEDMIER